MTWAKYEIRYLKENYGKTPITEIATAIARSPEAVYNVTIRMVKEGTLSRDLPGWYYSIPEAEQTFGIPARNLNRLYSNGKILGIRPYWSLKNNAIYLQRESLIEYVVKNQKHDGIIPVPATKVKSPADIQPGVAQVTLDAGDFPGMAEPALVNKKIQRENGIKAYLGLPEEAKAMVTTKNFLGEYTRQAGKKEQTESFFGRIRRAVSIVLRGEA